MDLHSAAFSNAGTARPVRSAAGAPDVGARPGCGLWAGDYGRVGNGLWQWAASCLLLAPPLPNLGQRGGGHGKAESALLTRGRCFGVLYGASLELWELSGSWELAPMPSVLMLLLLPLPLLLLMLAPPAPPTPPAAAAAPS